MADLRIVDSPLLSTVKGTEKIPTGGEGNFSVSVNQVADFAKLKWFLATEEYVDNAVGNVQSDLNLHKSKLDNPHQVTKLQVGLGNVDNTADLDKPVSNATQSAITTANSGKADKSYVDTQNNLKADKTTVEASLLLKADKADLTASKISSDSNQNQQVINDFGGARWYAKSGGYELGATVKLTNGDIVKSTVANNIVNPNVDMTGWVNTSKKIREIVSVSDFGAKGDDNQTVYDVTPYKTDKDKGITITQQTADGIAFNAAIKWLRNRGGGSLYIPPCESGKSYRVWGYLELIDFPCVIYGAGASSLVRNCDNSPTDGNGYGLFVIQPKNGEEVSFLNMKLDGVADIRAKPTSEHRLYPIVIYGDPKFRAYGLTSVNSPIDCLNINFDTSYINNNTFATLVSCYFDNSYRNTITCGKGENIKFTDCIVSRGGWVHGGTQPRYCVDIEPNFSSITVKTQWVNCTFSHGFNVLVGGVWTDSLFSSCVFDASYVHPSNLDKPSFPWVFQMTAGRWDVENCKFIGRTDFMRNQCHHYNAYDPAYAITNDSYLRIKNSSFLYCGLISSGRSISIENCFAQLSMCPFFFQGGTAAPKHDVFIKNLRLVNVFDGSNYGSGTTSSFAMMKSILGIIDIDGLTCEVDESSLNQIPAALFTGYTTQYGIWIPTEIGSNTKRASIKNVHCEGFYNRLHTYLGIAKSTAQRRDWGRPNLPPANTALINSAITANLSSTAISGTLTDGTVASNAVTNKAVTGTVTNGSVAGTAVQTDTIANRTLGGRTTPYYRDCTMWGDFA